MLQKQIASKSWRLITIKVYFSHHVSNVGGQESFAISHSGMQTEGAATISGTVSRHLESLTQTIKCSGPQTDTHHVNSQFISTSHMASANHDDQEIHSYTKYLEGRDLEIPKEQHFVSYL